MTEQLVLILGARSDIGRAIARRFAADGCAIILAARRHDDLESDVSDLTIRSGKKAIAVEFDVTDGLPGPFFDGLSVLPDIVIMVAGMLGDQAKDEDDSASAALVMTTNFVGPSCYLLEVARRMKARGQGCIVGISSVAGDRGRKSNFIYGSSKAGFTAFLSGLRNRLDANNIKVTTVKPGFVATQMTAHMKLPAALTALPHEVADHVWAAVTTGKDVVYVRPVWRWIMLIIRLIPETFFKKMSI